MWNEIQIPDLSNLSHTKRLWAKFEHFQQNNCIIEFGGGPLEVILLSLLLRACPTSNLNPSLKLEWSKPSPVKLWKSPGMENPQLLWPACSMVLPQPMVQIVFLHSVTAYLGLLPFCCVPLRRVWFYLFHNTYPLGVERVERYRLSLSFLTISGVNISIMCPRAIAVAFGWTLLFVHLSLMRFLKHSLSHWPGCWWRTNIVFSETGMFI